MRVAIMHNGVEEIYEFTQATFVDNTRIILSSETPGSCGDYIRFRILYIRCTAELGHKIAKNLIRDGFTDIHDWTSVLSENNYYERFTYYLYDEEHMDRDEVVPLRIKEDWWTKDDFPTYELKGGEL